MSFTPQFSELKWMFPQEGTELSVSLSKDPSISDWEQLIDWLNRTYTLEYNGPDEEADALPKIDREEVMRLMPEGEAYMWVEVKVGGVVLSADLNDTAYMCFELEAGTLNTQAGLEHLLAFMRQLGANLQQDVTLSDDARYSYPLITVSGSGQHTEIASQKELNRVSEVMAKADKGPWWNRISGWFKKA